MGNVVLIGSQKSDIGKTIISVKTGIKLSESGKKVILMDLSSGKMKISEYLRVNEDIIYDIKDVLESICSIDQALIEVNQQLSILPCPRIADKLNNIKIGEFAKLINEANKLYDIIIIDVDKISLSFIDFNLITHIVTVNNNDFSCIKELNSDKVIAQKYNVNNISAVLNKYNKKSANNGKMLNYKDIQKMTDLSIDIIIDENIKYSNVDYDFMFNKDDNSFNKAINCLTDKINL